MLCLNTLTLQKHPRRLQRTQLHIKAAMPAGRRREAMLAPWTVKIDECSERNYVAGRVHMHLCYSMLLM